MRQLLSFLFFTLLSSHIFAQSIIVNPDGTHSTVIDNGTTKTIVNPDGSHSNVVDNGTTKTIVNSNGTHSTIINNGTTKTIVNSNGTHSTIINNGSTKTIVNSNGTHSTIIDNGTTKTIVNADGTHSIITNYINPVKKSRNDDQSLKLTIDLGNITNLSTKYIESKIKTYSSNFLSNTTSATYNIIIKAKTDLKKKIKKVDLKSYGLEVNIKGSLSEVKKEMNTIGQVIDDLRKP